MALRRISPIRTRLSPDKGPATNHTGASHHDPPTIRPATDPHRQPPDRPFLNIVLPDIHQFLAPGFIDGVRGVVISGVPLNLDLLIAGAFFLLLPLLMIVLAQILVPRVLRLWNSAAAVIMGAVLFFVAPSGTDDLIHKTPEIAPFCALLWVVWRRAPRRE